METGNGLAIYLSWLVLVAAGLFVLEVASTRKALARFVSAGVLEKIVRGYSRRRKIAKRMMIVACLGLMVFAWAMPRVGKGMRVVKREGADVAIALDLSASMMTQDVKPNRLEAAKRAAETLVSRLEGNRIALVGFADGGFIYCPLTLDESAISMFLDYLGPAVVVDQGTNLSSAVTKSLDALRISTGKGKAVVLITDGEDHGGAVEDAIKAAAEQGVRVYALGVGTESGEPIPIFDGRGNVSGYKRDRSDNVVVSRLNMSLLRQIATGTRGESLVLGHGEREVTRIAAGVQGIEKGVLEQRSFEHYVELFQIPLGLALLLLVGEGLLGEKRRDRRDA